MSALIPNPFTLFPDLAGRPLDNGKIYIGQPNLDPKDHPVDVYWDQELTIAAVQPIPTLGGLMFNDNAPGMIYADVDDFSVRVLDKQGRQIYFVQSMKQANLFNIGKGLPDSSVLVQLPLTGAVERGQDNKNGDTVNALDFGIIPNASDDQSILVQAAFNTVAALSVQKTLYFPAGQYRLDNTINIPVGLNIKGECFPMYNGTDQLGTFFYLNHTGVGFDATGATGVRHISRIATKRNQPNPNNTTFTPNDHDWDFKFRSCVDIYMDDCLLLNPTRGIIFTHDGVNGANRFNLRRIFMQPLKVGVQVDYVYDVCRFTDIHFWPFWSTAAAVRKWMQSNMDAIYSKRNDNPIFTNIFSIWHYRAIRIGQSPTINSNLPGGSTSKLKLSNSDFDVGGSAYYVDSSVTKHTAFWSNVSMQGIDFGDKPGDTSALIDIQGSNVNIIAVNTDVINAGASVYRDNGTSNNIGFTNLSVDRYNLNDVSAVGFDANGVVQIKGIFKVSNGYIMPVFSSVRGIYLADYWRSFTPAITAATGTLDGLTINVCRWRQVAGKVEFELDFTIVSNGTGANAINCSIPIASPGYAILPAREIAITKSVLSAVVVSGTSQLQITSATGGYPASDGARIVVNGTYNLND